MNTRQATLIATIVVIALLAIGIGYAYTAITSNSGNDGESEYVKLSQSGLGSYQFAKDDEKIYYDTDNVSGTRGGTSDTYKYYLSNNSAVVDVDDTDYQLIKIGDKFNIDASEVNNAEEEHLPITFTTTNINVTGEWKVLMKVEIPSSDGTVTTTEWKIFSAGNPSSWNDNSFDMNYYVDGTIVKYRSVGITIYYGYQASVHETGTDAPADKPFNGATIKFTATVDGSNVSPVAYDLVLSAEDGIEMTASPTGKVEEKVKVTITLDTAGKVFKTVKINNGEPIEISGTSYVYTVKSTDAVQGKINLTFTTDNTQS